MLPRENAISSTALFSRKAGFSSYCGHLSLRTHSPGHSVLERRDRTLTYAQTRDREKCRPPLRITQSRVPRILSEFPGVTLVPHTSLLIRKLTETSHREDQCTFYSQPQTTQRLRWPSSSPGFSYVLPRALSVSLLRRAGHHYCLVPSASPCA